MMFLLVTTLGTVNITAEDEGTVSKEFVIPVTYSVVEETNSSDVVLDGKSPVGDVKADIDADSFSKEIIKADSKIESDLDDEQIAAIANGASTTIELKVSETNSSQNDQNRVKEVINKSDSLNFGVFMDIEILCTVTENNEQVGETKNITKTDEEISISVKVPDNLLNKDPNTIRSYSVLRLHNGSVDPLEASFNSYTGMLTFKTDRFSLYAIAFKDVEKESGYVYIPTNKKPVVNTAGLSISEKDGIKLNPDSTEKTLSLFINDEDVYGKGVYISASCSELVSEKGDKVSLTAEYQDSLIISGGEYSVKVTVTDNSKKLGIYKGEIVLTVKYKNGEAAIDNNIYKNLIDALNEAQGRTVIVLKDIELNNEWAPVETFSGTLDGKGYTISNLHITGSNYVGLIGVLDGGTIKNLNFDKVNISGAEDVGTVVGRITNNGKVENVNVLSGTVSCSEKRVGGLVGSIKAYGSVINCSNAATVTATGSARNAGGIVGSAYYTEAGKEMYISNCTNTGPVTSGTYCAGGIASLSAANVSDCKNSATIQGSGTSIGGIVGEQKSYGSVINNINTGNIENTYSGGYGNGGIIGWLRYHGTGEADSYQVSQIIEVSGNNNSGSVSGGNDAGGIIGSVYNSAVVKNNTNTATSLSGTTFAAGIVGNYQTTETPAGEAPASNNLTYGENSTSTEPSNITANCKDYEIYTNGNNVNYSYTGTEILVNPYNIQGFLDGKYGSIDNKTLVLAAGNYNKLEIGRATKYPGSNTDYYIGEISEGNKKTLEEFLSIKKSGTWSGSANYVRNIENLTLRAEEGVEVNVSGILVSSGHHYGETYDYVLDKAYTSGSAYYLTEKLKNIVFEGITFTSKVDINSSLSTTTIDGVMFKKCTFNIGNTASGNQALRYYNENNDGEVRNLTVDQCTFNECFQGVYTQHINGITVTNCIFDKTGHNAIAIQSGTHGAVNHKAVVITGNTFSNIGDRIIRFGDVGADTQITIQNNTATNSGDSSGQVIKAQSLAESVTYNISGNNWGEGKTVANNEFTDK